MEDRLKIEITQEPDIEEVIQSYKQSEAIFCPPEPYVLDVSLDFLDKLKEKGQALLNDYPATELAELNEFLVWLRIALKNRMISHARIWEPYIHFEEDKQKADEVNAKIDNLFNLKKDLQVLRINIIEALSDLDDDQIRSTFDEGVAKRILKYKKLGENEIQVKKLLLKRSARYNVLETLVQQWDGKSDPVDEIIQVTNQIIGIDKQIILLSEDYQAISGLINPGWKDLCTEVHEHDLGGRSIISADEKDKVYALNDDIDMNPPFKFKSRTNFFTRILKFLKGSELEKAFEKFLREGRIATKHNSSTFHAYGDNAIKIFVSPDPENGHTHQEQGLIHLNHWLQYYVNTLHEMGHITENSIFGDYNGPDNQAFTGECISIFTEGIVLFESIFRAKNDKDKRYLIHRFLNRFLVYMKLNLELDDIYNTMFSPEEGSSHLYNSVKSGIIPKYNITHTIFEPHYALQYPIGKIFTILVMNKIFVNSEAQDPNVSFANLMSKICNVIRNCNEYTTENQYFQSLCEAFNISPNDFKTVNPSELPLIQHLREEYASLKDVTFETD
jgi:hypothetical protein